LSVRLYLILQGDVILGGVIMLNTLLNVSFKKTTTTKKKKPKKKPPKNSPPNAPKTKFPPNSNVDEIQCN